MRDLTAGELDALRFIGLERSGKVSTKTYVRYFGAHSVDNWRELDRRRFVDVGTDTVIHVTDAGRDYLREHPEP